MCFCCCVFPSHNGTVHTFTITDTPGFSGTNMNPDIEKVLDHFRERTNGENFNDVVHVTLLVLPPHRFTVSVRDVC